MTRPFDIDCYLKLIETTTTQISQFHSLLDAFYIFRRVASTGLKASSREKLRPPKVTMHRKLFTQQKKKDSAQL